VALKDLAKRSRPAVIAYYLQHDFRARLAQRNGTASSSVRTGGHEQHPAESDAYAQRAFRAVLKHAGLTVEGLRGLRVLELGPGNDLSIARLMLTNGAGQVVALDRFGVPHAKTHGLAFVEGVGVEDAPAHFGPASFDLVYSVAVLEHVADFEAAIRAIYQLLAPGGITVHSIGGGDHGMFTDGGKHPLTYMTIPEPLYRLMTAHSGGPNRVLVPDIRRAAARYDWEWRLEIEERQDAEVEQIRPRLRSPFRDLPATDLTVTGTTLICRAAPRQSALSS
jgi:SAM-dependent methyltransferase